MRCIKRHIRSKQLNRSKEITRPTAPVGLLNPTVGLDLPIQTKQMGDFIFCKSLKQIIEVPVTEFELDFQPA